MTITIILACVAAQYFLNFASYPYRFNWIGPYTDWMTAKIPYILKTTGLVGLLILIIPILLLVSILFASIYHLLGVTGYFILSLLLFWYFLDARDLLKNPYPNVLPNDLFVLSYQNQFAPIFWFAILGPVGLMLYVSITGLRQDLSTRGADKSDQLLHATGLVQGVLDWVPIRLLGLSFALVGHFGLAFKTYLNEITLGVQLDCEQAARWGIASLQAGNRPSQVTEVVGLLNRALLVWLIVIALLSIAFWLG